MRADLLADPHPGLAEVLVVVDGFDQVLCEGFGRPNPARAAGPRALATGMSASPLADATAEAVAKALAGTADESHFAALAAARSALLGAAYDALTACIDEATGRTRAAFDTGSASAPARPLLAAARAWLADVARAGWRGLDHDLVAGSDQVVDALLDDVDLRRLATLLDGFVGELDALCPGATADRFPVRRWADLWSRATLLAQPGFDHRPAMTTATGRLLPLGVDLTEHPTAAQAQVHAVFEPADGSTPQLVRAAVSVAKPHTVVDAGIWKLLTPHLSVLVAAAEGRTVEIDEMAITASGDLVWDEAQARLSTPADPFATARAVLQTARAASLDPLDRHPVALAEPVFIEGYSTSTDEEDLAFELPGYRLRVDTFRVPVAGPLTRTSIAQSTACIGLLRWDAGAFVLQPLAIETTIKKKPVTLHAAAWATGTTDKEGAKGDKAADLALTTLRERAGKLLRA